MNFKVKILLGLVMFAFVSVSVLPSNRPTHNHWQNVPPSYPQGPGVSRFGSDSFVVVPPFAAQERAASSFNSFQDLRASYAKEPEAGIIEAIQARDAARREAEEYPKRSQSTQQPQKHMNSQAASQKEPILQKFFEAFRKRYFLNTETMSRIIKQCEAASGYRYLVHSYKNSPVDSKEELRSIQDITEYLLLAKDFLLSQAESLDNPLGYISLAQELHSVARSKTAEEPQPWDPSIWGNEGDTPSPKQRNAAQGSQRQLMPPAAQSGPDRASDLRQEPHSLARSKAAKEPELSDPSIWGNEGDTSSWDPVQVSQRQFMPPAAQSQPDPVSDTQKIQEKERKLNDRIAEFSRRNGIADTVMSKILQDLNGKSKYLEQIKRYYESEPGSPAEVMHLDGIVDSLSHAMKQPKSRGSHRKSSRK